MEKVATMRRVIDAAIERLEREQPASPLLELPRPELRRRLAEAHLRIRNLEAIARLQHRLEDFARTADIGALGLNAADGTIFQDFIRRLDGGDADVR